METQLFNIISKHITLTEEEKKLILELNQFKSYPKDTMLLKAGDISNECYFVMKGCIRYYYIIDGEEKTMEFYTESESLSPFCSMDKKPSEYYISCVEDSILSVVTPKSKITDLKKIPRFETLCRLLTEELLVKNQDAHIHFKNATPEQRYLKLVETRPDLIERVPQYQIASYLGLKPEALSRIRKRLSNKEET